MGDEERRGQIEGGVKPAGVVAERRDTFCVHPWMHLRLQVEGEAAVCCRYRNNISADGKLLSLRSDSFDRIWNAEEMLQIRRQMIDGVQVPGCAECYEEEAHGAVSMRVRDNTAWQNGWLNPTLISIEELKAKTSSNGYRVASTPTNIEVDTGSLCNLKCRMCHDLVSSRIASDLVHRTWATDQYAERPYHDPAVIVRNSEVRRWTLSKELEEVILASKGEVKRLYFIGGEPFLVREVGDLLRRLVTLGVSREIIVAVVSNGTVRGAWLDLMEHFQRLELSISIDGYGPLYDYIRYPGKWSRLVANLSAFRDIPNVSLGAAVTLQFYNALNICELFRFLDSMGIGFYAWPVHVPRYLSVDALPPAARLLAAHRLMDYAARDCRPEHCDVVRGLAEHLRSRSDAFDSRLLRDCMLFTNDLDVSRRQSLVAVNPELVALCESAGFRWTMETLHANVVSKPAASVDSFGAFAVVEASGK